MLDGMRHTLRGCVDWNYRPGKDTIPTDVTPFVGVWIETRYHRRSARAEHVTPFVGVWIETCWSLGYPLSIDVTPFVGVWIETRKQALRG